MNVASVQDRVPCASGPRWCRACLMREAYFSLSGSIPSHPAIPHILGVFPSYGAIDSQRFRDETIQPKLSFSLRSTSFSHPPAQVGVGHQSHHTCEERRLIFSRYNKASLAIFDERRHTTNICGHHGASTSHGLHHHIGTALA